MRDSRLDPIGPKPKTDKQVREEATEQVEKFFADIKAKDARIESLQARVEELEEENKAWEDDSIAPELQFLCKRHLTRIESLQARVEELERGMKFWQERSADRQKTLDLCANQQLKLEARLAKYEDKVLPEEVTRQVERLRLQCIWQRMQGTDRGNDYPYHKHLPDCDICRSAELIERLARTEKP